MRPDDSSLRAQESQGKMEVRFPAAQPRRGHAAERAFTLIELTVVVVIIAVFAALSIPQVVRQLRDRRVHETAQRVASFYRDARLRAMGQGGAVLVRYTQGTSGQGMLEMREARMGSATAAGTAACAEMPDPSCLHPNWDNTAPSGTAKSLTLLDLGNSGGLDRVFLVVTGHPPVGGTPVYMDVCYTPMGRAFVSYAAGSPLQPLTGVPRAEVYRSTGAKTDPRIGLTRTVLVPPSGVARLQL